MNMITARVNRAEQLLNLHVEAFRTGANAITLTQVDGQGRMLRLEVTSQEAKRVLIDALGLMGTLGPYIDPEGQLDLALRGAQRIINHINLEFKDYDDDKGAIYFDHEAICDYLQTMEEGFRMVRLSLMEKMALAEQAERVQG